ncbi:MAG: hypothetical protein JW733_04220 [Coriobacteriia bacterium]|nr:hypothetical protein [Coriobacteriia bacterium]MBN2848608.1 hypothetical protein [Coriobacteriia bacterium]
MDTELHAIHVARVSNWFSDRGGHGFSVVVRTGPNEVSIAAGAYLGIQEHPTTKGVFRARFRDDRRISINPDEEKYISFGFELQGVDTGERLLVLDKGSQTIEITDLGAPSGPSADEVVWPEEAPVAPAPQAAVAPPASQTVEVRARATVYGNSMGSGFFGPVTVRIEQGQMSVTGMRSSHRGGALVGGAALLSIGVIGLVFGLIVAGGATSDSDMGAAFCLMGVGMLFLLVGLGLYFTGRARFMRGEQATLSFPLSSAVGRKVRYDTNLGCLLTLVATPVVGLIVMLAMGRRIVRLSVPNDRGQRPANQMVELKMASNAEGAILDTALRG